ncbi:uncharacterized protein IL334_002568 [Kwoniella shivajii]|uniref:Uncharacterized protein n=1 Tax=Kwoniella shivajii TaxID=564305 RepID=A0ABZ1CVR1_9TREE|nr:hypothetical protein IL334_002568 [Kwoniella shivajii]
MRFTSPNSKPSLTPVGYRLLHLSEQKLSNLDGSLYDEGPALLKGVLVREAVKSAWKSVQEGSVVEMNDWTSLSAMGLDVVSEEDEDEIDQESNEERWFEDLVSSFNEDETEIQQQEINHEWVESKVSEPVFDDLEYDVGHIEAFTFPNPLSPPTLVPALPIPQVTITDVSEVEVGDDDSEEGLLYSPESYHRSKSTIERFISASIETAHITPILHPISSPLLLPPSPIEPINSDWDESLFIQPQWYNDFDDYVDEFSLPPPLIRSLSSSSNSFDDEEERCSTPPLRYSELDESSSWFQQLKTDDPVDSDSDESDDEASRRFEGEIETVLVGVVGLAVGFGEPFVLS